MNFILPLLGVGLLVVGMLAFWAAVQNWIADLLDRARMRLGSATYIAQSALIILDRAVVGGQRVVIATARLIFANRSAQAERSLETVEEVKRIREQDLPSEVLEKLNAVNPAQPLQYELALPTESYKSNASNQESQPNVTYRLAVQRHDDPIQPNDKRSERDDAQPDQSQPPTE